MRPISHPSRCLLRGTTRQGADSVSKTEEDPTLMTVESTSAKRTLHSCLPCLYLEVGYGGIESPHRRDCNRQTPTFRIDCVLAELDRIDLFSVCRSWTVSQRSTRSDRRTMLALSGSAEPPWRFAYHRAFWAPSHPLQLVVTNMQVGPDNRPSNVTSTGPFWGPRQVWRSVQLRRHMITPNSGSASPFRFAILLHHNDMHAGAKLSQRGAWAGQGFLPQVPTSGPDGDSCSGWWSVWGSSRVGWELAMHGCIASGWPFRRIIPQ